LAIKWHVKLRRTLAKEVNLLLAKAFTKKQNNSKIPHEDIKRVLIIRMNYRIGNILFQTPLINAISKIFPDAKIDMVIGAPFITPLIKNMPNINNVYSFDRKLLTKPLKAIKLVKEVNSNNYDLTITSNLGSSSDKIATLLLKAKYKVGFYSSDQFLPITHSIKDLKDENFHHEALKPLKLVKLFDKNPKDFEQKLNLLITDKEKQKIEKTSDEICIFRDARGEKKFSLDFWQELVTKLKEINPNYTFVDVLDPNNKTPLFEDIKTISEKNLRDLAVTISTKKAFICGDTGPMHLASATKTPTIALFKTTSPSMYGTLGDNDLSIVTKDLSPKELATKIASHLETI